MTKDGQPYGSVHYKEIVKECYVITKNTNISYEDVLKMSPLERRLILGFLLEEFKKTQEMMEKAKQEREINKSNR